MSEYRPRIAVLAIQHCGAQTRRPFYWRPRRLLQFTPPGPLRLSSKCLPLSPCLSLASFSNPHWHGNPAALLSLHRCPFHDAPPRRPLPISAAAPQALLVYLAAPPLPGPARLPLLPPPPLVRAHSFVLSTSPRMPSSIQPLACCTQSSPCPSLPLCQHCQHEPPLHPPHLRAAPLLHPTSARTPPLPLLPAVPAPNGSRCNPRSITCQTAPTGRPVLGTLFTAYPCVPRTAPPMPHMSPCPTVSLIE